MKPILQLPHNCWQLSRVRAAGLLVDGREYFLAFTEAARQARRFIALCGWQFDSGVPLWRGSDEPPGGGPAALLPFLDDLCARNRRLHVYILAWDFSMFYTLKREFLQSLWFSWNGHPRIRFRFDSSHPLGASQHQKFVVIDGRVAFVGGMDLCEGTWDDRTHRAEDPLRIHGDGEPYPPRHDVQAYVVGRAARRLSALFRYRWRQAGGGRLRLRPARRPPLPRVRPGLPLAARRVALSRTFGETLVPHQKPVTEVRQLFADAIRAAESLIYVENQYFAAHAVYEALIDRLQAAGQPKLEVVIMLPRQPEAFIEEIGLGSTQARLLRALTDVAQRTGHALGVYNTRTGNDDPGRVLTFVHSKLLIVDDRFLTVGSANFSNRSMGFDSELNLAWEARSARQGRLRESIRAARVELLAEHCGASDEATRRRLAEAEGLVKYLDEQADQAGRRLCHHRIGTSRVSEWVAGLTLHDLLVDPEKSVWAGRLSQWIGADDNGLFARGISLLNRHLFGGEK